MASAPAWDPEVAIPTLVGSVSSFAATSVVLFLFFLSRGEKSNLRYVLVINLTVAEFINSLNNTVSGAWVVLNRERVPPGPACQANGWIGQVSVQAADFSVLAIAVATVLTLHRNPWILASSFHKSCLICASVWAIPFATGSTALFLDKLNAASGNWCWIARDPPWLRYALGHAWRLAIFVAVAAIYACVFVDLRRLLRSRKQYRRAYYEQHASLSGSRDSDAVALGPWISSSGTSSSSAGGADTAGDKREEIKIFFRASGGWAGDGGGGQTEMGRGYGWREGNDNDDDSDKLKSNKGNKSSTSPPTRPSPVQKNPKTSPLLPWSTASARTPPVPRPRSTGSSILSTNKLDQEMVQWALLVLYPLAYMALWVPGMANRLAELTGHDARGLAVAQASTQFVGLANALVYGLREHRGIWRRLVVGRGRGRGRGAVDGRLQAL